MSREESVICGFDQSRRRGVRDYRRAARDDASREHQAVATRARRAVRTDDEVRARVVSLAAGTALAVCVLAWTAANVGPREGWLAFIFLLGTYGFASRATEALTDMLLTLLLFAAYCAIRPLLEAPPNSPGSTRRTLLVGVILGCAVLTKGPVAIVLCALSALVYLIVVRRNPLPLMRERWPWQSLAMASAFGAIWYFPAAIMGGQKILRIIFAENFGHFMPTRLGGTGESYRPLDPQDRLRGEFWTLHADPARRHR